MKVRVKVLDYEALVRLNESSIRSGRRCHLRPGELPPKRQERYPVTTVIRRPDGKQDVHICVVLSSAGQTAWLDLSPEEFAAIPEVEGTEAEWEWAFCAGTPPEAF